MLSRFERADRMLRLFPAWKDAGRHEALELRLKRATLADPEIAHSDKDTGPFSEAHADGSFGMRFVDRFDFTAGFLLDDFFAIRGLPAGRTRSGAATSSTITSVRSRRCEGISTVSICCSSVADVGTRLSLRAGGAAQSPNQNTSRIPNPSAVGSLA